MESTRSLVTVMLAILIAACTPTGSAGLGAEGQAAQARQELSPDGGAPPCPTDAGTCVPVSPTIVMDDACPNSRLIAAMVDDDSSDAKDVTDPNCPEGPSTSSGRWAGSLLFASTTGEWSLPPGLSSFCAYEWEPGGSTTPSDQDVERLRTALGLRVKRLDPDCLAVAPLGTSATVDAAWTTLHEDFHEQTGQVADLPQRTGLPPVQVRVAVVDSSPHSYSGGEAVEDRLGHGHAIGRIVRELGCPDGSTACIAQVSNHLALPQLNREVKDLVHGGYFGAQTELAVAIHSAVSDWRSQNAGNVPPGGSTAPQPRLVINLSLAWQSRYGGAYQADQLEQLPAPVRAVHAAITHAVCRGALVIAAAGNDPGGPDVVFGPEFPAGWETKPAPGLTECGPLEGPGYPGQVQYPIFPPAGVNVYRPLVYAVGGVKANDQKLASTRPGGRPRLAAPGAHAVASDVDSNGQVGHTDVNTGTSISSAVVSGIAAVLWGYRPMLSGPEIMQLVREGSVDLSVPADFCLGGFPCPWNVGDPLRSIGRVSLCQALEKACTGAPGRCPSAPPPCTQRGAYASPLPQLTTVQMEEIEKKLTLTADGSKLVVDLLPPPVCRQAALRTLSWRYDKNVCPFRQYYGIPLRPWTNPQPSKNPCTLCLMELSDTALATPSATVYISIDSEFSARSLYSPSLLLNGVYEVNLTELLALSGQTELSAGDEVKVTNIPIDSAWLPITSAALTMQGEEAGVAYSTFSELLLQ